MLVLAGDATGADRLDGVDAGRGHGGRARRSRCATRSPPSEADALVAALGRHLGNREGAAEDLGISRAYLDARCAALGLGTGA